MDRARNPGGQTRILLSRRSADPDASTPRLVLVGEDVDAVCERLLGRGVEFTEPPGKAPWEPDQVYALF